jgi:site-specific recombinase XerD
MMRVTILFLLRTSKKRQNGKCPIYVRVTHKRKRIELATGLFAKEDTWDAINQKVEGRSADVDSINNRIHKIYSNVLDAFYRLETINEDFSVDDLKSELTGVSGIHTLFELFDYYIKTISDQLGTGFSAGTLKHYKTSKNRLKEYVKKKYKKEDVNILDVDYSFIADFDTYLKKQYGNNLNTVWGYHKHVKKILNIAVSLDYLLKNPYVKFKVKKQETKREFLTLSELKTIRTKEIDITRLSIVRDIFLFACYTGLSYVDIAKLNTDHIQKGVDGGDWIIIDRTKTSTRCRVPLLDVPKEILERYKNYPVCENKGLLLPVLTNQRMNSYLKELADICHIKKNLTMHVARHSFATSVTLNNGIPIETVSKMLGHTSIKTTQVYAKIVDEKISKDMKKLKAIL